MTSPLFCSKLFFSSFRTMLHDLLWLNGILNVGQYDRNYIYATFVNGIRNGHEIGYFDTSKNGTSQKLVLAPMPYLEEIWYKDNTPYYISRKVNIRYCLFNNSTRPPSVLISPQTIHLLKVTKSITRAVANCHFL